MPKGGPSGFGKHDQNGFGTNRLCTNRLIFQFSSDFLIHYGIDRYEQSFLYFVERMRARTQSIKTSFHFDDEPLRVHAADHG